jgi:iron(III) transport system substrate-binding protein
MQNRIAVLIAAVIFLSLTAGRVLADWKSEWDRVVGAAKREGQLNLYVNRYGQAPLLEEFRKDHPEIRIVTVTGGGSQLVSRVMAEARAGNVVADLFSGGSGTALTLHRGKALEPLKPAFILPEVLDESKWYGGRHAFTDPERQFVFVYIVLPGLRGLGYNRNLVDPEEFRSYRDLLNPKWKGRIVAQRPALGGGITAHLQFYYHHPELGPDFMRRFFGAMDMTFGDQRTIDDWLAAGKFAICLGCREIDKAKGQGLPVDHFEMGEWKEGEPLSTGGGSLGLMRGAPHPNAARVFINWFLSRRGQTVLQMSNDLLGAQPPYSRRIDIPKEMLPPETRLVPGRRGDFRDAVDSPTHHATRLAQTRNFFSNKDLQRERTGV